MTLNEMICNIFKVAYLLSGQIQYKYKFQSVYSFCSKLFEMKFIC